MALFFFTTVSEYLEVELDFPAVLIGQILFTLHPRDPVLVQKILDLLLELEALLDRVQVDAEGPLLTEDAVVSREVIRLIAVDDQERQLSPDLSLVPPLSSR